MQPSIHFSVTVDRCILSDHAANLSESEHEPEQPLLNCERHAHSI